MILNSPFMMSEVSKGHAYLTRYDYLMNCVKKQIINSALSLHLKSASKINFLDYTPLAAPFKRQKFCLYTTDIEGLFYLDFISFLIASD